jgi:organic radical activating enzyme
MHIKFILSDRCNLKCTDCHWFSGEITDPGFIDADATISWCHQHLKLISNIKLTGGEPTLHPEFVRLANSLQELRTPITVYSNGTNLEKLRGIVKPCNLYVGINRPISPSLRNELKNLHHHVHLQSYLKAYADENDKRLRNQLAVEPSLAQNIDKQVNCHSNTIRFATDGHAYQCEVGLRSKDPRLRCSFSLRDGLPSVQPLRCRISKECVSNFPEENRFDLL